MSKTHGGGNAVTFNWGVSFDKQNVVILNENGKAHLYLIDDICDVLKSLKEKFNQEFFPLANNVEKLPNGTEKKGLGKCLYEQDRERPIRVTFAQGASYLGVVLEEIGVFEWNQKEGRGIKWRIRNDSNIAVGRIRTQIFKFVNNRVLKE